VPELLLELLSEEIPARMQARAAEDLKRLVCKGLNARKLSFTRAEAFVTPRRLALVVEGLPEQQPDLEEPDRQIKKDAPDKALEGFVRDSGASVDIMRLRYLQVGDEPIVFDILPEHSDIDIMRNGQPSPSDTRFSVSSTVSFSVSSSAKGEYISRKTVVRGRPSNLVMPELLQIVLIDLQWPKSMRWGSGTFRWVRPLQNILALFDGVQVAFTHPLGDGARELPCGARTRGHRFLAPEWFGVRSFADYKKQLFDHKVVVDQNERRRLIREQAEALAATEGLSVRDDEALLDEVTGLVEWPVVMLGRMDAAFMDVPDEVLVTAMRTHQKYFSLLNAFGKLAPRFVLVANTQAADGGAAIVAGNERVLRARLSDAKFFWNEDRKRTLESRVPKLAERVFHARLGSDFDRTQRLSALSRALAPLCGADPDMAERAARLCKADLTSAMVGEFPELQGVMGRYYALHDGEPAEVADAIAEHYAPQGPSDRCPSVPLSVAVALADKLDTLVGFFAIDERPTGSKDPYALRRAALGVIRLIIETGVRVPLRPILATSYTSLFNIVDAKAAANAIDQMEIIIEGESFAGDTDLDLIKHYLDDSRLRFFVEYEDIIKKLKASPEIARETDGRQLLIDLEKTIRHANTIMWKRLLDSGVPPELEYAVQATNQLAVVEKDYPSAKLAMLNAAYRLADDLLAFFADRLKVHLREQGVRHDLIAAVFAGGAEDDIVRLLARVEALRDFLDTDDGANLLTAYRRASNIVRIEENKDGTVYDGEADERLLEEQQEIELYRSLAAARARIAEALAGERFGESMAALAGLRAPVDAFFDHVTVNCSHAELRANRLRLLSQIRSAFGGVADFSQIEG
jgi:glycyl-tRNA synthetase beta chain